MPSSRGPSIRVRGAAVPRSRARAAGTVRPTAGWKPGGEAAELRAPGLIKRGDGVVTFVKPSYRRRGKAISVGLDLSRGSRALC